MKLWENILTSISQVRGRFIKWATTKSHMTDLSTEYQKFVSIERKITKKPAESFKVPEKNCWNKASLFLKK